RSRFPEHSPKASGGMKPTVPDGVLKDGEKVAQRLKLITSPGHDNDCVCFLDEETGLLITGDSLQGNGTICQGIGFYKSLPDYRATLDKLSSLPVKAILCGHDYDGIGCYIEGKEATEKTFDYCKKRIDVYGSFVSSHRNEDPPLIAEELIKKEGCGMPPHLFMALYTVTEHLKEVSNHG
ncbi:MAG: MBL fold metallo-hydrolase, partial [Clostridia bacterium]|nr:MBL fold metallo-hydrolase [Clostridia bacterium]